MWKGQALAEAKTGEELLAYDNPLALSWIAFVRAQAGQKERAREGLRRLMDLSEERYVDPAVTSIVHAGLGETELMLTLLEAAYKERSPLLIYIRAFPDLFLSELDVEPRFHALLDRMGLH